MDELEVYQLERALEDSTRTEGETTPSSPQRLPSARSSAYPSPATNPQNPRSGAISPDDSGRGGSAEEEEDVVEGEVMVNASTDTVEIDSPLSASAVSPSKDPVPAKPFFLSLYLNREPDEAVLSKSLLLSTAFHLQVAILAFLDPVSLGRVSCASGHLSLAASHDIIWKGMWILLR